MDVPQEMVDDFRNHLWACFKYLGLGEPTPVQYAMADALQNGPNDMQLQAGRGFGKSVITACLASWFLVRDPNTTIMVVSATGNKAVEFISMTRRILDLVPYCEHLKPGDHTTDNAFGFNVESRTRIGQDKSCYAKGITAQITGSHAEYLIFDDVEIEGNCETAMSRQKLLNKCLEAEQIRNVGGRVIFLGTPQIKDSIYNQLKEGYPITKFPAVMPDITNPSETEDVNEWILELEAAAGEPTQPERFTMEVLMERLAKVGPTLFSLHYKLDTSLADKDKYPLKLTDLLVLDLSPDLCPEKIIWASSTPAKKIPSFGMSGDCYYDPMWISDIFVEYQDRIMFIDPSGRGKDETGICIASFSNGYIFVHELLGLEGGYERAALMRIAKLAYQYNINHIRVESNYGDAMFNSLLRPVVSEVCGQVAIDEYRVSGQKERRMIAALEPVMAQHRLVFDTKPARDERNQRQITRLTEVRGSLTHDDRVDVLSAACNYWEDRLHINVDDVIEKRRVQNHVDTINQWMSNDRIEGLLGSKVSGALRHHDPDWNKVQRPRVNTKRSQWGRRY
jgi:hypothetical protein